MGRNILNIEKIMGRDYIAWDKKNKQMVDVCAIEFIDYAEARPGISVRILVGDYKKTYWLDVGDFDLREYTGKKDKNGVKIFDGDIVNPHNPRKVFWSDTYLQWWAEDSTGDSIPLCDVEDLVIIGNIYKIKDLC